MGRASIGIYTASFLEGRRRTLQILNCLRSREYSLKACVTFAELSPMALNVVQEAQPGISDIQDLRGEGDLEKWKRIHQSTSLNSSALHSLSHRHDLFWTIPGKTCMNKGTTLSFSKVARELLELKSDCPEH